MTPDRAPKTSRSSGWPPRPSWRRLRGTAERWQASLSRLTGGRPEVQAEPPEAQPGLDGQASGIDAEVDGETGGRTGGTGTLAGLLPAVIGGSGQGDRAPIPWKTIWATIGIVLAAVAIIELILALKLVIGLVVMATFFAIVLTPPVNGLTRFGMRRGLATGVVFVVGLAALGGLGYLFIHPLYREATRLSDQVPDLLAKTQAGKGPLGGLISRYHLQKTAATEIPKFRAWLGKLGGPALSLARTVIAGIGGIITIGILTFLILLEGPTIVGVVLRGLPPRQSRRVARIMHDVARSVTGYVVGNTTTSFIAGIICGITLAILGVPFAVVFAVWVAMVDYLPLIGGLLAGVPTVAFALLHSPTAGIITAIVFLVYQQVENHVLNPVIMSRTVRLNPLWVILSVLAGAQLASIVGALLAIPLAGAIQVIARDLWQERRARREPDADAPPASA
jgi:predicted PurR-regulated permease PerM